MGKVKLGDFVFDLGPRREIQLGGTQAIVRHDVPGAGPSYHDMGPEEAPVSWSGVLDGPAATAQALQLDDLRLAGQVLELTTGLIQPLQVRIKEFKFRVIRKHRVEYDISLVQDGGVPDFTPPADTTESAAGQAASNTYTVVSGDTLYAIAVRFMGDGNMWPAIAQVNGITDPTTLQIGQVLQVPASSEASGLAAQYKGKTEKRNTLLASIPAPPKTGAVATPY
jgi:LysM repeat protein